MTKETVLLNDFKRQWDEAGADVMAAVRQVGESGWYILGESVEGFERDLASAVGRKFAVGCASGLDRVRSRRRARRLPLAPRLRPVEPVRAFASRLEQPPRRAARGGAGARVHAAARALDGATPRDRRALPRRALSSLRPPFPRR